MPHDLPTAATIAAVFLLAGMVKGIIGLGLPTIAIGLLGLFLPPAEAAALLVLPSALTNLWQALSGGLPLALLRRLLPLLAGLLLGAALGAMLGIGLSGGDAALARRLLGAALLLYGGFGLVGRVATLPEGAGEGWAGLGSGLVTGMVTAATGVFVLPAVPYLQALGLERRALLQAMGLSFGVSTLALAASLPAGSLTGSASGGGMLFASALALAPTLLGMVVGQRLHLPPLLFRRIFFAGLLGLGAHLALA
ncbi:TSUP family transporter [Teichococcus oryzae]|nr:TSUP family transporter [Pseudoroseomonas oryzae]